MNIDTLLKLDGTERYNAIKRLTLSRLLAANEDLEQAETNLESAIGMQRN